MAYKRGSVRTPRRKLVWARTLFAGSIASQAAPQDTLFVNLLGQFETQYGADMLGCTIMRIRGNLTWSATGQTTVPSIAQLIVGVRIATQESSLPPAPLTELPDTAGPALSPHSDWMLFHPVTSYVNGDGSNVIDAKSMRKLDELGQYLLMAIQPGNVSMAATVNGTFSTLLALP